MVLKPGGELDDFIWQTVHQTPAADVCSELNEGALFSSRALEVDALLGTGAALEGLFRRDPRRPDNPQEPLTRAACAEVPLPMRAEMVWHRCFQSGSPLNERAREILTSFGLLGAGAATRDLNAYRTHFRKMIPQELTKRALLAANLNLLTLSRDFFSPEEAPLPEHHEAVHFLRCLSLDILGTDWDGSCARLKDDGYPVRKSLERESVNLVRGLLQERTERLRAQLVSLTIPEPQELSHKKSGAARLLTKCVLPHCAETGLPLVLRLAGRGVAFAALRELCAEFAGVPLLLAGSGAEQLAAALELAREFAQVHPVGGCGLAVAGTVQQNFFRQGLELLGGGWLAFASGAEHVLQLPGRWAHARWQLGEVLRERYAALARTGWAIEADDVRREIEGLLCGNALRVFKPQLAATR